VTIIPSANLIAKSLSFANLDGTPFDTLNYQTVNDGVKTFKFDLKVPDFVQSLKVDWSPVIKVTSMFYEISTIYTVYDDFLTCQNKYEIVCILFDNTRFVVNMYSSKFYSKFPLELQM
jgi:hypothetical protein